MCVRGACICLCSHMHHVYRRECEFYVLVYVYFVRPNLAAQGMDFNKLFDESAKER